MSYKELLYNNQIIKQNENCTNGYKNCGIIDTLEQNLCMPIDDECPLYDVGIAENEEYNNSLYYRYDENAKIYYNNNNYNKPNKKIIGKLILNEGQPCFNLNEKLWRKFVFEEKTDNHLKCENDIFGKKTDDRFEKKGGITYYDLYEPNLDSEYFRLFPKNELKTKYVSLYKREFLGIDKACDEKTKISQETYDKLKLSQKNVKRLLIVEPVLILVFFLSIIYYSFLDYSNGNIIFFFCNDLFIIIDKLY